MLEESLAKRKAEDQELYALKFDGATKNTNTGQQRIKKVRMFTAINIFTRWSSFYSSTLRCNEVQM